MSPGYDVAIELIEQDYVSEISLPAAPSEGEAREHRDSKPSQLSEGTGPSDCPIPFRTSLRTSSNHGTASEVRIETEAVEPEGFSATVGSVLRDWRIGMQQRIDDAAIRSDAHLDKHASNEHADSQTDPSGRLDPTRTAIKAVRLYSKIAAGVGLLPFGLVNFAGVLVIQIAMVWRIAGIFGDTEGKDRIRCHILALFGAALPTSAGQALSVALTAVPAALLHVLATPAVAFASTRVVGNIFIMHFQSAGTLLTFDPQAFKGHIAKAIEPSRS